MQNNPIRPIMDDRQFSVLAELNLLNKKLLRDIEIRKRYFDYKEQGLASPEAIQGLLKEYPYLQFDTIRKIVYSRAVIRIEELLS